MTSVASVRNSVAGTNAAARPRRRSDDISRNGTSPPLSPTSPRFGQQRTGGGGGHSRHGSKAQRKSIGMRPRIAIITGASSGIGRASAVKLSSEGWIVVLSARRENELAETAALCAGETLSIIGDIAKEEDIINLFERTIAKYGRLDLLFNNAGLSGESQRIDNLTLSNFLEVMNVNVTASVLCSREAFKIFRGQSPPGGRIINNGSLSATTPRPEAAAYAISKHAISGLTKSTALDGRPFNITATQIDIGNAATAMLSKNGNGGTLQANGSLKQEPSMDVSHVANAIAHIASLPNEVTLLEMTLMATGMPFVGRG